MSKKSNKTKVTDKNSENGHRKRSISKQEPSSHASNSGVYKKLDENEESEGAPDKKQSDKMKNPKKNRKVYVELLENKIKELSMELTFVQDQIKLDNINRNMDRLMQIVYGLKNLQNKKEPLSDTKEKIEQLKHDCKIRVPERSQLIQSHFSQFKGHYNTPFLKYFSH